MGEQVLDGLLDGGRVVEEGGPHAEREDEGQEEDYLRDQEELEDECEDPGGHLSARAGQLSRFAHGCQRRPTHQDKDSSDSETNTVDQQTNTSARDSEHDAAEGVGRVQLVL